jgi:hypothetical protein
LKRNLLAAKTDIKDMNERLMVASSKCATLEEDLDTAVYAHIASMNTVKQNIETLSRHSATLNKMTVRKEAKMVELQATATTRQAECLAQQRHAKARIVEKRTQCAMLAESMRSVFREEERQREREQDARAEQARREEKRTALNLAETTFYRENAINMKLAGERIFPARAAG